MFITLKNGDTEKQRGMQQIRSRSAGPGGGSGNGNGSGSNAYRIRPHTSREPCLACQYKKVRCTGRSRNCDRCISRSQACIFPTPRSTTDRHEPQSSSYETSGLGSRSNASESSKMEQTPLKDLEQEPNGFVRSASSGGSLEIEGMADVQHVAPDQDEYQFDEFLSAMAATQTIFASQISSVTSSDLRQNAPLPPIQETQITPPDSLAGTLVPPFDLQSQPGLGLDNIKDLRDSSECPCLPKVLRVVQELDDDHYHITSLSLDQVLRLQKSLITQCDETLGCSACSKLPAINSMVVIICDRLTEMFECMHKRIKRINQRFTDGDGTTPMSSARSSVPEIKDPDQGQLFCGTTGEVASGASCNLALFLPEFQDTFSSQEQLHMLEALFRLQIRSFQGLFAQLGNSGHVVGSQARQSKVNSLMLRLARAAGKISEELRRAIQILPAS